MDIDDRKIGLSLKRAQWGSADDSDYSSDDPDRAPRPDMPTRGGMDDHGAMGSDKIEL